ncbi:hypothetical protein [Rhodococcus qingshengii]|uniref:hypothetical protein n=1 Tax=Rhodococcus qingshengii TaxID=334542 RepID=UPI0035D7416F
MSSTTYVERLENKLGLEFVSDPRKAKFPFPELPSGHDPALSHIVHRMTITPEMARDIIQYRFIIKERIPHEIRHKEMRSNRKIRDNNLKKWTSVLHQNNSEGIIFNPDMPPGLVISPDGFVLDAQHKICAIHLSGVTAQILTHLNTPWATLDGMDTPMRRTADQLSDVPYPALASQAARYIMPAIHGTEKKDFYVRGHLTDVVAMQQDWPWFRANWSEDIHKLRSRRIPSAPLASVVYGALAAGADPFEVQSFLDGIFPDPFRSDPAVGVGSEGKDPRRLIGQRYGTRLKTATRNEDKRSDAGIFRLAMTSWLSRKDDKPLELSSLFKITGDLPPFWNSDAIRDYYKTSKGNGSWAK